MKESARLKKRYKISIFISLTIIALVAANLAIINSGNQKQAYIAKNGIMDISNWTMDENIYLVRQAE